MDDITPAPDFSGIFVSLADQRFECLIARDDADAIRNDVNNKQGGANLGPRSRRLDRRFQKTSSDKIGHRSRPRIVVRLNAWSSVCGTALSIVVK